MSDEGSKTTELPAVSPVEIAIAGLAASVERGFAKIDADLETVKAEGQRTNLRLTRQEVRMDDVETRLANTSNRARAIGTQTSEQDLAHDAQLAQERSAREALAAKVDSLTVTQETQLAILARLDRVAANPFVKDAAKVLVTAFLTWLATKGLVLK